MNLQLKTAPRSKAIIPPIVPIILAELASLRARGRIAPAMFEQQIQRLAKEELQPRGMVLRMEELPNGYVCLRVRDRNGTEQELMRMAPATAGAGTLSKAA